MSMSENIILRLQLFGDSRLNNVSRRVVRGAAINDWAEIAEPAAAKVVV